MINHPLFANPGKDGKPPEVLTIRVERWENNQKVSCPHRFAAEELCDLEQLAEMFGGGKYELIARDDRRITAREAYVLPGPSRPLTLNEEPAQPQPAIYQQVPQGPGFSQWLPLIAIVVPALLEYLKTSAVNQHGMLMGIMNAQQSQAQTYVQQTQQLYTAQMAQLSSFLEAARGGGGPPNGNDFQDGVEWMQNFVAGQIAQQQDSAGSDVEMLRTIQQALAAFQTVSPPQQPSPNGAP